MFKDIFNSILGNQSDKNNADTKAQAFQQWLENIENNGESEPELQVRIMMYATLEKTLDDNVKVMSRVAEINHILDVVVDDWKSKYISKGKSVPDEADEPMRKHVLSVEFPGTYTEDEGRYFQCEAHAIILGISLDEYLEERKKGDKDIWLNPTK